MASITQKWTATDAVLVHECSLWFKATAGAARARLREKILSVWPELSKQGVSQSEDVRSVTITPEEQMGIAEGVLAFLRNPDETDAKKAAALTVAKLCNCKKHVVSEWAKDEKPLVTSDAEILQDEEIKE